MNASASLQTQITRPLHSTPPLVVAALYKFVHLDDCRQLRTELQTRCDSLGIRGTLLLAPEGINGTVSGPRSAIDSLLAGLRSDARFADLTHKESAADLHPFQRMKVRIKAEIVTLGQPQANPTQQVGEYVEPAAWNALIQDPEVRVIDTRNDYEFRIGSFARAEDPGTRSFRDFPAYVSTHLGADKKRKLALFCTGGIRCEKATAYLLSQGYEQVYHLKGGILNYLETVAPEKSLWRGECFVFDARVSVGHGLEAGTHSLCQACGWAVSAEEQQSAGYVPGLYCPHCRSSNDPGSRTRA